MSRKLYSKFNIKFFNVFSYVLRSNQSNDDACSQEKLIVPMWTEEIIILDDDNAYEIDEYPQFTDTQLESISSALYGGAKSDVSNYIIVISAYTLRA